MVFCNIVLLVWTSLAFFTNVATKENDAKYTTSNNQRPIFKMTNTNKHLLWFIQISDLHLSIFRDISRIEEFKKFCHSTINIIKPLIVIASGDLTDGKASNDISTYQVKNEWVQYYSILNDNNVANKTMWLDIRGNHDGFNIISLNSSQNYFVNYSVQGKNHARSYMKQILNDDNIYSFVALDSCLDPGPSRPFHFVGLLDKLEVKTVKNIISQIQTSGSNYSIWFGHFPTSAILAQHKGGVRRLISEDRHSVAYLSGHFHTFGNIVPNMYALHSEGFLELELGDWRSNRLFRLLAFDHGLLSFIDVHHNDWPIVLITNPKHALFVVPQKENLNTIKQSSHIRILVFSPSEIDWVKVKINEGDWHFCKRVEGPLYVSQWNPDDYLYGLQAIHVFARDISGKENYVSQPFSLDGTHLSFSVLAGIALKSDVDSLCKTFFGIMFAVSVLPMTILKCLNILVRKGKLTKPRLKNAGCWHCLRKLWILTTVNRIFWPLWLYPIYLAIGPWTIGLIIEDYWGAFFTWGIIVYGAFLPGTVTYGCAGIQLFIFHVPLTIILSNGINRRFMNKAVKQTNKCKTVLKYMGLHLPMIILLGFQVIASSYFLLTFGVVSCILGIVPTWSAIYAIMLWHKVLVLPESCIIAAAKIWSIKIEPEPNQLYSSLPNTARNADSTL